MKYDFTNPDEAVYRPEIQDLIGRYHGIYEGDGFDMDSYKSKNYDKEKLYEGTTGFCLEQEYCLPESVGVMHTVDYYIVDYCFSTLSTIRFKDTH